MPPYYEYSCQCGARFDRFLAIKDYKQPQSCECGNTGKRVISVPLMVTVQQNVEYESPTSGRTITSMRQRANDMAKSDCIEYDPGMKQDYKKRIEEGNEKLEKSMMDTVDREIAKMPPKKREALASEVMHAEVGIKRLTT